MIAVRKEPRTDVWYRQIDWELYGFLLLERCLPGYAFWLFLAAMLGLDLLRRGGRVLRFRMAGRSCYLAIAALGGAEGLLSLAAGQTAGWPFVRDGIHVAMVFLCWQNGWRLACKNGHARQTLYATVFFFAGTSLCLCNIRTALDLMALPVDPYTFIQRVQYDAVTVALGTFFCFVRPGMGALAGTKTAVFLRANILAAFAITFSRTTLLLFGCLLLCAGVLKNRRVLAAVLVYGGLLCGVLVLFLPAVTQMFADKLLHSVTELSSAQPVWDAAAVVENWRGYEVYCAKQAFARYPLLQKYLGRGFGASVDAGGYAFLVTTETTLPYLHNGYYTTLIKLGYAGLALHAGYLAALFRAFQKKPAGCDRALCLGLVAGMGCSTVVTHGELWGGASFLLLTVLAWNSARETGREAV